jgi:hypothetical protein
MTHDGRDSFVMETNEMLTIDGLMPVLDGTPFLGEAVDGYGNQTFSCEYV